MVKLQQLYETITYLWTQEFECLHVLTAVLQSLNSKELLSICSLLDVIEQAEDCVLLNLVEQIDGYLVSIRPLSWQAHIYLLYIIQSRAN